MSNSSIGQIIVNDSFDYADDAALQAVWSTSASLSLNTTNGNPIPSAFHSGEAAIHQPIGLTFNITPTAASPVLLSADIWSSGGANQRNSVGLRTGANPLFEMGMYNAFDNIQTGPDTVAALTPTEVGIGVRMLSLGAGGFNGQSWIKFGDNYSGWARWEAIFTDVTTTVRVDLGIDSTWDYEFSSTRATPVAAFSDLRFGGPSGLSSTDGAFAVDNIRLEVIPEPSTIALGLMGGLGLAVLLMRRRRR